MKKLIVILSIFISFSNIIFSQDLQINWQQCFGGSKTDIARDIILSGNCFLTVGYTGSNDGDVSYNHGDNDVWLIKTDSIGALIWEKSYGGSTGDGGCRIIQADNNSFYILGNATSSDGDISNDPYPGNNDYWILKIDSTGNILWEKILG
ncbi:MAG: T9SS C-terminal target domain-containing protein, partial [Bacteroidetes bacterium]|nr:T9SS C-terminal target domain-containing protein [Bacteroidota bacterium]